MRVSLLSGALLAMPVIVYQLLRFILPGLTTKEKRWVMIAVPSASVLFAGGVLFAYYVMLPPAIQFLTTFLDVQTAPRLSNYMGFVINIMFWIGISFEVAPFDIYSCKAASDYRKRIIKTMAYCHCCYCCHRCGHYSDGGSCEYGVIDASPDRPLFPECPAGFHGVTISPINPSSVTSISRAESTWLVTILSIRVTTLWLLEVKPATFHWFSPILRMPSHKTGTT